MLLVISLFWLLYFVLLVWCFLVDFGDWCLLLLGIVIVLFWIVWGWWWVLFGGYYLLWFVD